MSQPAEKEPAPAKKESEPSPKELEFKDWRKIMKQTQRHFEMVIKGFILRARTKTMSDKEAFEYIVPFRELWGVFVEMIDLIPTTDAERDYFKHKETHFEIADVPCPVLATGKDHRDVLTGVTADLPAVAAICISPEAWPAKHGDAETRRASGIHARTKERAARPLCGKFPVQSRSRCAFRALQNPPA